MANVIDFKQCLKEFKSCFNEQNFDVAELYRILEHSLGISYSQIFTKECITKREYNIVKKAVKSFIKGKPVNKIFKTQNFFGKEFYINNHVLAPRQDTEILVDQILKLCKNKRGLKILDLCTGSGCIAVSLQSNLDDALVDAVDASFFALKVAKINNNKFNCNIRFIKSDLFAKIKGRYDVIVSNPPYIKSSQVKLLDYGVKKYDPKISLDGGVDGLYFYRQIASKAKEFLNPEGVVAVEIGYDQKQEVENLFKEQGFSCKTIKDYGGNDRVIIANLERE